MVKLLFKHMMVDVAITVLFDKLQSAFSVPTLIKLSVGQRVKSIDFHICR